MSLDGSLWIPLVGAALFFTSLLVPAMASSFPTLTPRPLTVKEAIAAVAPIPFHLDEIAPLTIEEEPVQIQQRPQEVHARTSYDKIPPSITLPTDLPPGWRTEVVKNAYAHIGTHYVWGGDEPGGFDCSGFVKYVMAKNGVDLPRTARQMGNAIPSIPKSELQAGDLVFFRGPDHVGIYVGNGDFIHASSGQHRVTVSDLSERSYTRRYAGSGRLAN